MDKLISDGKYDSSQHFNYLKDFKSGSYGKFNDTRKEIVHYSQFESSYRQAFVKNFNHENEMEKYYKEKYKMPEYFKKMLEESCDGYLHAFKLIKEFV